MRRSGFQLVIAVISVGVVPQPAPAQPGAIDRAGSPIRDAQPGVEAAIDDDVNVDHAFWMPTAIGQRRGTWKFSSTELVMLGASYAVTDRLGVTPGGLPPDGSALAGWLTVKWQLLRAERFFVALHLSNFAGYGRGDRMDEQAATNAYLIPTLGVVATLCVDRACRSSINGWGYGQLDVTDRRKGALGIAGSVILHLGGGGDRAAVKVVAELLRSGPAEVDEATASVGWAGFRCSWRSFGFDVGVVRTFGVDGGETDELVPLFPWLKLAYRLR
jgi:hypothetical protein